MILDYVKESLSLSLSLGERGGGGRGNNPMFHTCGLNGNANGRTLEALVRKCDPLKSKSLT